MSATTQELENDIAQMEDRLADVKVVVEVEREAWRQSFRAGKRGTKWKGAAAARNNEKGASSSSTTSANNPSGDCTDEDITIMPGYWDTLELAQYLKAKQLGSYAQVVVCEQITGKILLDTPAPKLRKLFEAVETSANDPSWKDFQKEHVKLKKHQRRFEKAVATNRSQPNSSRSLGTSLEARPMPSTVISSAGAALVFPLISPRVPGAAGANISQQQNIAKPPTASKPTFLLRKPASSNNIPMATCWNCKTRFFRPHIKRPVAGASNTNTGQPVSSSMRASLVARAYCSQACQESIESSDIRISPSLSASVKVTFGSSNALIEEKKTERSRPSRAATGLASISSSASDQPGPELLSQSDSITANRLGGSTSVNGSTNPPPKAKHVRKFNAFARRSSRPDAALDDPNSFDFLHVAAPRREGAALTAISPRQNNAEGHAVAVAACGNRGGSRPLDVNASGTFTMCPSVTSLAVSAFRATATPSDPQSRPPNGKLVPPALTLTNSSTPQGAPKQCKVYQQSRYKLDPDLFQAQQESFSSCFGAIPLNNRPPALAGARVVDYGRGNLLRLQEFLTARALHRLSLTSRAWYDLITVPSGISDALWGVHVLRIWRPTEEDEGFLHDIGVLKKPERPRRMLQILTRQVSRVILENMKVLLNPESWQLATVMSSKEGEGMRSLHQTIGRTQDRHNGGELSPRRSVELYEQITAIYTRAGEIVAVCARQLIRPVDPMALLTDILQGLKSGELRRVNCRRLRLFSQTNRLPFDQWALLQQCSRTVVEFFWSGAGSEVAAPLVLPVWHQKTLSKLQHALQQRLLGRDSVNYVVKLAHDQDAPGAVLLSLEKFLARCHTHSATVATTNSSSSQQQQRRQASESHVDQ
ncbi:hypothetical protein PHYPSEUDO_005103 [Phytophthora pseudosyringae]|uniref:F-box domain-containing protein n=1 Tax=Phytophthora pseudosyringae TaxID=221518 RepID=A0A8T1VM93_9STRA|nr:hypothetical protein PHYPSEUDO_005103 [Phytophthora pseudosyringae]